MLNLTPLQVYYVKSPGKNKAREHHPESIPVGGGFEGNVKDHIDLMEKGVGPYKHKGDWGAGDSRVIVPQPPEIPDVPIPNSSESPSSEVRESNPLKIGEIPIAPGNRISGVQGSQNFIATTGQLGTDALALVNQIVQGANQDPSITSITVDVRGALPFGSDANTYNSVRNSVQDAKNNILQLLQNGGVPDNISLGVTPNTTNNVYQYSPNESPNDPQHKNNNGISFTIE